MVGIKLEKRGTYKSGLVMWFQKNCSLRQRGCLSVVCLVAWSLSSYSHHLTTSSMFHNTSTTHSKKCWKCNCSLCAPPYCCDAMCVLAHSHLQLMAYTLASGRDTQGFIVAGHSWQSKEVPRGMEVGFEWRVTHDLHPGVRSLCPIWDQAPPVLS